MTASKYLQKLLSLHGIDIHTYIKGGEGDKCGIDTADASFRGGILDRANALFNNTLKKPDSRKYSSCQLNYSELYNDTLFDTDTNNINWVNHAKQKYGFNYNRTLKIGNDEIKINNILRDCHIDKNNGFPEPIKQRIVRITKFLNELNSSYTSVDEAPHSVAADATISTSEPAYDTVAISSPPAALTGPVAEEEAPAVPVAEEAPAVPVVEEEAPDNPVVEEESVIDPANPVVEEESVIDPANPVVEEESVINPADPVVEEESVIDPAVPVAEEEAPDNPIGADIVPVAIVPIATTDNASEDEDRKKAEQEAIVDAAIQSTAARELAAEARIKAADEAKAIAERELQESNANAKGEAIKNFSQFLVKSIRLGFTQKPKKNIPIPNIKQLSNGIDPTYGGGFIMFDGGFNIGGIIHTGYSASPAGSSLPQMSNSISTSDELTTFIQSLKTPSTPPVATPLDISKIAESIKTSITRI
jgi:hypothetical protein